MSRDRIISAAKVVLGSEGAPGLTVRKVAEHAQLSPMAMYRHFANKDALLDALMADGLAAWEQIALAIRAEDPLRWLEALGESFLEFALSEPHRFDAAFFLPAPRARQYPPDFTAGRSPVMAMVTERFEKAQRRGVFAGRDTADLALGFSALAQGLMSMQRANRFAGEAEFRKLYRQQIRQYLAQPATSGSAAGP